MSRLILDRKWLEDVRDEVMTAPLFTGRDDDRPWSRWECRARKDGAKEDLVLMGSTLMALSCDWTPELQIEFGWLNGGAGMLYKALTEPQETRRHWTEVLDRDKRLRRVA